MSNQNEFTITKQSNPQGAKFEAVGFINMTTSLDLEKALEGALQAGENDIILDMSKTQALTSFGIRVLLKTYKTALAKGGSFQIQSPSSVVENVLKISNLDMLVKK